MKGAFTVHFKLAAKIFTCLELLELLRVVLLKLAPNILLFAQVNRDSLLSDEVARVIGQNDVDLVRWTSRHRGI